MSSEFSAREKLHDVIAQIDRLLLSDFPHPASEAALSALKVFFQGQLDRLNRASAGGHTATLRQACVTVNERIHDYLPILGFLLRSTNVRNSFEAYGALSKLARILVGPEAKFVLSSEWEFSPLTYPMNVSVLPEYVLLGLPAPESHNALVLPLAGHEFGHSVWRSESLEDRYAPKVDTLSKEHLKTDWSQFISSYPEHKELRPTDEELSNNLFLAQPLAEVSFFALSQLEEIFCDALGIFLFGPSFLHAFHYLLAPTLGGYRSPEYPPLVTRATYLEQLSEVEEGARVFDAFAAEFEDRTTSMGQRSDYSLKVADAISRKLAPEVFVAARGIVQEKAASEVGTAAGQARVLDLFRRGIPSDHADKLTDILNAGWAYVIEKGAGFDSSERRIFDWISELVLKTIEVSEFRERK